MRREPQTRPRCVPIPHPCAHCASRCCVLCAPLAAGPASHALCLATLRPAAVEGPCGAVWRGGGDRRTKVLGGCERDAGQPGGWLQPRQRRRAVCLLRGAWPGDSRAGSGRVEAGPVLPGPLCPVPPRRSPLLTRRVPPQVFDGHGGREAAVFCKDHLVSATTMQPSWPADVPAALVRAHHPWHGTTGWARCACVAHPMPPPIGRAATQNAR